MALQTSGPISLLDIKNEFGGAVPHSLSEYYGAASGIPGSGQISFNQFYGKANIFSFNITSNKNDANLRTLALNAGWDGSAPVRATINSGVVISGSAAGNSTPAMRIDGSFPSGVTLINNGQIRGRGGIGGNAGSEPNLNGRNGARGGRALIVSVPVSINNQGIIGAGGGGGGGGGTGTSFSKSGTNYATGGGGGGGRSSNYNASGGVAPINSNYNGGSGIISSIGLGGSRVYINGAAYGGYGGNGGDIGANGGNAVRSSMASSGSGGPRGQAINGNGNVTWINTGTRLGVIV